MRRSLGLVAALSLLGGQVLAQSLEISSDTTTVLAGVVVDRRQPAKDDGATIVPTALGPTAPGITLPDGADLDAFDRLPTGEVVFSTDVTVAIPGLTSAAGPADVVLVDAQGPTVVFSASAAGVPAGSDVDAVGLEADSDVLLSSTRP